MRRIAQVAGSGRGVLAEVKTARAPGNELKPVGSDRDTLLIVSPPAVVMVRKLLPRPALISNVKVPSFVTTE